MLISALTSLSNWSAKGENGGRLAFSKEIPTATALC